MPGGDRTGPRGKGSRTGWGMGFCGEPGKEEKEGPIRRFFRFGGGGWGFGRGRGSGWGRGPGGGGGWGRGWRRWFGG